ncbi:crotonase/enoyl-CoA hydratase family protein [Alloalcanivorax marinus]|uniref:crotonase/enoyl-CoA hydratase family protein n=1 Tax=Alloalcanivorax marinus TaxID=1177169 RepID=UPI00193323B6|nr:crotonase/enoyl-CoA hydratase family protein [Alloalcanivorax marinus]MBL7251660.1 crotonase/enoyl-CoA hydratase family protein [Alloalcanivorax marinus]
MSELNSGAGRVSREKRGAVFLIGLDRAGKRNAFDSAMITDLSLALGEYERDDDLRCAVIFGHGDVFTAGLDLMELAPKLMSGFGYPDNGVDPWGVEPPRRTKPVVVAVQGECWTAGIELMLNADIVVASEEARFAQVEVLRGIAPVGGATARFVQAAGWHNAMLYMLTGEAFTAERALSMRLVNEVVATGEALQRALVYAERIAKAAPLGVKATLQSAFKARDEGEAAALSQLNNTLLGLMKTQDVQEGIAAMMQKREPQFRGH